MTLAVPSKTKSEITIPPKAHPYVRLMFGEMAKQNVTYESLEWASGVLISTFKAWRADNRCGLETIEAALGSLGWELVPVPRYDRLPKNVQDGLEAFRDLWKRDEPILHQFLAVCCEARDLPTKVPSSSRFQQAAKFLSHLTKSHLRIQLAHPIPARGKKHGSMIDAVTVRIPKATAPSGGDFKGGAPIPSLEDYVALPPAQVAELAAEDTAKIMRVAQAMRAAVAAAPVLVEFANMSAVVASAPTRKKKVAA